MVNGELADSRYAKAGDFQISEYDMQVNSGVIDVLNSQPVAAAYLGDNQMKKQSMLSFWTRPTINWSLTCEGDNRREKVLEVAGEARFATDMN